MGKRSISDWVAITKNEKGGWAEFYQSFLAYPLSDTKRFLKAVDDFGHTIMFESVIAAGTQKLTKDPLNYVIAIAISKINEEVKDSNDDIKYKMRLDKSKERVILQNEELERKLEKARNVRNL